MPSHGVGRRLRAIHRPAAVGNANRPAAARLHQLALLDLIFFVVTDAASGGVSAAGIGAGIKSFHDCKASPACPSGYYASNECGRTDSGADGPASGSPSSAATGSTNELCCCRSCRDKCGRVDYEHSPCIGKHDRQCKDIDTLPKPSFSSNLVYENKRYVKQIISAALQIDNIGNALEETSQLGGAVGGGSSHGQQPYQMPPLTLKRDTGFTVHIAVKEANLAPLFTPVDHSRSNDNEHFRGDSRIMSDFCPFPVPEKYQLSTVLHQGVTTKAKFYNCDIEPGKSLKTTTSATQRSACVAETGYYMDPRQSCESYSVFGRLPSLDPGGRSVVCTRPGRLADTLGLSHQLMDTTFMFIDKSMNCAEMRGACDTCTAACARNMQSHKGSHRCNITADDADNGESPRLQYCFSCCSQQECAKQCQVYQLPECQQTRCITGNVAEFTLTPIFSVRESIFACHVHPVRRYKIYDIEFWVTHQGKIVNEMKLTASRLVDKVHPQRSIDVHKFLRVYYGSEISVVPNLIEGDSVSKTFSAGYYQAKGQPVQSVAPGDTVKSSVTVRPLAPFSISSNAWKTKDCEYDMTTELLVPPSGTAADSDPYRREAQLEVQRVQPSTGTGSGSAIHYRLFNTSRSAMPFLRFEIPRDASILREVYGPTTVTDDNTLRAELVRQPTKAGWVLTISGRLHRCPGAFGIIVKDPDYSQQPLFDYDVGTACPGTFNVEFVIPTEGSDDYDKTLIVHIVDSFRTIKITVFRPAPNITMDTFEPTMMNYESLKEKPMTVVSPLLAIFCVVIGFLGLLLVVGFITDNPRDVRHLSRDQPTSKRLLFVVCYATFRATYSLTVTFTLLVLLMKYANREAFGTLSGFSQYVSSVENIQWLEMEKIQTLAAEEVARQNSLANSTKTACELKLAQLQNQFEEAKQQMRLQTHKDRLVSQVALQYTKLMILNLTESVIKFKREFSAYARKAVDRLTRSMAQTSNAVQSNKWFAGARIIYDAVKSKRSALGLDTKPFAKWAGLELDVEQIVADLSLKDFPLPNLTDFLNIDLPQTTDKPAPMPRADDVILPRNQWYYQYERKPIFDQTGSDGSATSGGDEQSLFRSGGKLKIRTGDIISWASFLAILVAIDVVWFVHRMARTYSTTKMILYGCPAATKLVDNLDHQDEQHQSVDEIHSVAVSRRCFDFIKDLNLRLMKTDFVPKLVATVSACVAVYVTYSVADRLLTVRTLASIGYFEALVSPVETSHELARTRVRTNADRINRYELPFYADLVNARAKRYRLLLEMYAEIQRTAAVQRDSEYCAWQRLVNPSNADAESCRCTTVPVPELRFDGCPLPPVSPLLQPRQDFNILRRMLSQSIYPHVCAARNVVAETLHLFTVFVAVLVVVDTLSTVTWIYLRRFGLLQTTPIPEVRLLRRFPSTDTNHTASGS